MPRSNETEFMASLSAGMDVLCKRFTGAVLLAPQPTVMADQLGVSKGMLYHYGTYSEILEQASGLNVIHDGLVLGGDGTIEPAHIKTPFEVALDATNALSPEDKMQLIARLALGNVQK